MDNEYKFNTNDLEKQIPQLSKKGITEFSIHDENLAKDKRRLIKIINLAEKTAPEIYYSFLVDASIIDRELVAALMNLFCSIDIPLECVEKGGKILFDKKFYANKANLLNSTGIVFGFQLNYATEKGDSLKSYLDRLDFAVNQYPNHIDFPQTENSDNEQTAQVSGLFSAKDIRYARDVSFACRTFYSAGRAVPWMLNVLKPLKIYPSRFFADFAEWQRCNNCDFKSGFVPEGEEHKSIEKMQLLYLSEKYEEKNQHPLIQVVNDVVVLNGAISRLDKEGASEEVKLFYSAEDLLSEEVLNLQSFIDNVCMEPKVVELKIENGELKIR